MDLEKLKYLIAHKEDEHVEFKKAKQNFSLLGEDSFTNRNKCVLGYCVGIGNEGGGYLLLGVNDDGVIAGTSVQLPSNAKKQIFDRTEQKIEIFEIWEGEDRVVVVSIPSRPTGKPLEYANVPLMRIGESLEKMTPEEYKRILLEGVDDFSARLCEASSISSIDQEAMEKLRNLYQLKHPNNKIATLSDERLLSDLALMRNGKLTYAGIILLATEAFLQVNLGDAEICFEYRNSKDSPTYNDRVDYRKAFVLSAFEIWEKVSSRQQVHTFVDGLFRREILAYNEEVVREALFNAVCHRDYEMRGSIFIKQSSEEIEITSPGGFINGITSENIISSPSTPRNRLLAEVFQKIFLGVERSGQGADKIFRLTISDGKGAPEYLENTGHWVALKIPAILQDANFVKYLEKVTNDGQYALSIDDILKLEKIRIGNNENIALKTVGHLVEKGFIELYGRTRGAVYILARKYYQETGRLGERTRRIGLARDKCKELLLEHIRKHDRGTMAEFIQIFPELKKSDINNLLAELKKIGLIAPMKKGRYTYWIKHKPINNL